MRCPIGLLVLLVACKSPPAKESPKPFQLSTTCNSDSDCVISCESKGNCCNAPYCESVQTAAADTAIRDFNAKHCNPDARAQCPVVGGAPTPDYVIAPRCKEHACVAEKVPHIAVAMWNRACKADADCIAVKTNPCPSCGCPDEATLASNQQMYTDAVARIQCPSPDPTAPQKVCGECKPPEPVCVSGQCALKK